MSEWIILLEIFIDAKIFDGELVYGWVLNISSSFIFYKIILFGGHIQIGHFGVPHSQMRYDYVVDFN